MGLNDTYLTSRSDLFLTEILKSKMTFTTSACFVVLLSLGTADINAQATISGYTTDCKLTPGGHEYAGTLSTTASGKTCQRWTLTQPHYHTYMNDPSSFPGHNVAASRNYCRNPDPNWHHGVWCYTTDPTKRWENCNVTLCECKISITGSEYQGRRNKTRSGYSCQNWTSQTPHNHTYSNGSKFPDRRLSDAANYCRNPGGNNASRPNGPWCYTIVESIEWEYCDVQRCEFQLMTITSPTTTVTTATSVSPTTTKRTTLSTTSSRTVSMEPSTTHRPSTSTTLRVSSTTSHAFNPVTSGKTTVSTQKSGDEGQIFGGDDKTRPVIASHKFSTTTVIASTLSAVVFVVVCVVTGVILYKKGMFKNVGKCSEDKDDKSFDNPAFNVETNEVDMHYSRMN